MKLAHLPTPFSAEEIRANCGPGTFREFHISTGGITLTQKLTFVKGDEWGTAFHFSLSGPGGGDPQVSNKPYSLWTTFQSHASYPASETTLRQGVITVPAGRFPCWIYKQTDSKGTTSETYFAKSLPGPPVYSISEAADGTELTRMELISFSN